MRARALDEPRKAHARFSGSLPVLLLLSVPVSAKFEFLLCARCQALC